MSPPPVAVLPGLNRRGSKLRLIQRPATICQKWPRILTRHSEFMFLTERVGFSVRCNSLCGEVNNTAKTVCFASDLIFIFSWYCRLSQYQTPQKRHKGIMWQFVEVSNTAYPPAGGKHSLTAKN